MTELAIPTDQTAGQVAIQPDAQVQRLAEWANAATAAHRVAQSLVQTSFVPAGFRDKPAEATAAILAGMEIGLQPMAALRSFDVIQGIAAPRALTLRAVVQSKGHEIEIAESTATRCVARGRRRGASTWQTSTWTIDRAKELGVTGKDNWKKQPQAMLVARATSEIARLIAADALLGLGGYSAEEVADGAAPSDVTVEPQAQPATRTLSRSKSPAPEPETPAVEKSTKEQRGQIRDLFDTEGVAAADRPGRIAAVVGREIKRMDELTAPEADALIEALIAAQPEVVDAVPVADPPADADADDPTLDAEWGKS